MAHEILSVKMYELDKKLEQTHSRIQLAESMDTERLHQQIQNVRKAVSLWKTDFAILRQTV